MTSSIRNQTLTTTPLCFLAKEKHKLKIQSLLAKYKCRDSIMPVQGSTYILTQPIISLYKPRRQPPLAK